MSRKTVLIVDDHDFIREAYALLLERYGFSVLTAKNGGEAIMMVRQKHPDVVVMDLAMPVVNGLEATESLKEFPDTANIPIIGVTAHSHTPEQERLREICDGFLQKPCAPGDLIAEVRRLASPPLGLVG